MRRTRLEAGSPVSDMIVVQMRDDKRLPNLGTSLRGRGIFENFRGGKRDRSW